MCWVFSCFHQHVQFLKQRNLCLKAFIKAQDGSSIFTLSQEPLGFPKDRSWQRCMWNLSAGSLPASLPRKTCSWSRLHLAPVVPRVILRSGDFAADHRPPSSLNTTNSLIPRPNTGLVQYKFPEVSFWIHVLLEPYKVQKTPSSFHLRLTRESSKTPIHREHQVSLCSSFFLLPHPFPPSWNPISKFRSN